MSRSFTAGKDKVIQVQRRGRDPARYCVSRSIGDLKLHRPVSLLLHDDCSGHDPVAVADILHPHSNQVASTKLAVDTQIEQGKFTISLRHLEPDTNCPDLFQFERSLLPDDLSLIPWFTTQCRDSGHVALLPSGGPISWSLTDPKQTFRFGRTPKHAQSASGALMLLDAYENSCRQRRIQVLA
jgi:hypothetical protein